MNSPVSRPDLHEILSSLKDFQRNTADYVFQRLYTDPNPTRRFLIADEVGLGKTLVARGVIAQAVDFLWDTVERIDVVYICSNSDIARQNINKLTLNIPGTQDFTLASRITMLPTTVSHLQGNKINFISFTPGTSFNLKSNLGTTRERALLYCLLNRAWGIPGTGPLNVLQGKAKKDNFRSLVYSFEQYNNIDETLAADFSRTLERHGEADRQAGKADLKSRFEELCQRFRYPRKHPPDEDTRDRARLVGELRGLLAVTCLKALQPDLIILDEFQRFKNLLSGDDEASQLARELFEYTDESTSSRVLLLSATPYKMYTISGEAGDEDHYQDFMDTIRFLIQDHEPAVELEQLLEQYRRQIYYLGSNGQLNSDRARALKEEVEARLRLVMVRTERLAVTEDRNGMLVQVQNETTKLEPGDIEAYVGLQKVAELLKQGDVIHYWKAAPYLLNFMDDYELKRALEAALNLPTQQALLAEALAETSTLLFPWHEWRNYVKVDPGNARLRGWIADFLDNRAWRLLWLPPAQPYYQLEGAYSDPRVKGMTKRLVFSAWRVVPKVIATLLSYEAERLMVCSFEEDPRNTPEARRRRRPLLRFAKREGRLTGMPVLGLLYPSSTLASKIDPLAIAGRIVVETSNGEAELPSLEKVLSLVQHQVEEMLATIAVNHVSSGPEDEAWYWAAPVLLDQKFAPELTNEWFSHPSLAAVWSGGDMEKEEDGEESHWAAHVEQARELLDGRFTLGRQPTDLSLVLAQMAIAGPGVCTLRALMRVAGSMSKVMKDQAARVAWSFRTLFNMPEVTSLLRGINREEPYWRRVLEYCVNGGLQSTLDEYVHFLLEDLGLRGKNPGDVCRDISAVMCGALTLRTATLGVDEVNVNQFEPEVTIERHGMRAKFALRYGDDRTDDGNVVNRAGQVKKTFNSPFWPFVLATTSVGQEGLDFHPYCHAVVHWDLPSNPVDLEQREGRVHRYKGHAVRKNLASKYGLPALVNAAKACEKTGSISGNPWEYMFAAAIQDRDPGASDLVPFWVYPIENGAKIERHVPALPLSRDHERLAGLRRSLAVYRMVFGQPRQEDLLAYLVDHLPAEDVNRVLAELQIDLSPPSPTPTRLTV